MKNFLCSKTLLLNACKNGNETVIKYLVEHELNINK